MTPGREGRIREESPDVHRHIRTDRGRRAWEEDHK